VHPSVYALLGAAIGAGVIWFGLRFHIGSWFFDGAPAYVGAALVGAVAALIIRAAIRRHFGLS
jgi:hypothetical protein